MPAISNALYERSSTRRSTSCRALGIKNMKLFIFNLILLALFISVVKPERETDFIALLIIFSGIVILFEFVILLGSKWIIEAIKS